MSDEIYMKKKKKEKENREDWKPFKPNEIQGIIEIPDTRERRDGPGGN